jgi:hypothetical protein
MSSHYPVVAQAEMGQLRVLMSGTGQTAIPNER